MRIIIATGGTAGHINPAIAIADSIKKNDANAEIIFIGTHRGMESEIVPRYGYKIIKFTSYGFQKNFTLKNIKAIESLLLGPIRAKKLIKELNPDFVIGMGGYFSWPILSAAHRLNIPCAIHESNAVLGRASKALLRKVSSVYTGFDCEIYGNKRKNNFIYTGTPLISNHIIDDKKELELVDNLKNSSKKIVLSFGGSLGSNSMNETIPSVALDIINNNSNIIFVHITGKKKYDGCFTQYGNINDNLIILDYFNNLNLIENICDLVISRCGAMTINEIINHQKASILIPFPKAINNHQLINAKYLSSKNAAILLEEKYLSKESLYTLINDLLGDENKRNELVSNLPKPQYIDSGAKIYQDIRLKTRKEIIQ